MLAEIITGLNLPFLAYVAVALAVIWVFTSWVQSPGNIPPYPVPPLPLVGHLPFMRTGIREKVMEWRDKIGDIFSLRSGGRLIVVVNSYNILKETFVKQGEIFSDRPPLFLTSRQTAPKVSQLICILGASGPSWKEHRTVSLSILRNFGMGKNFLAEKIQEEILNYMDVLRSLKGQPKDVRLLTNTSVSNVIVAIITGQRFKYDDPQFTRFMEIFNEQVHLASPVTALTAFPWLKYLPGDMFKAQKLVKNIEEMDSHFCEPEVAANVGKEVNDEAENFIVACLMELDKKKKTGQPTTMDTAQNLFVAGTETTSTTMMWFLLYMLYYPHIQAKVFDEINDIVGTEREPMIQDKPKLNYLNATIMETQRLASIVPLGLVHLCKENVNIRGYDIAGAMIMPNLDAVLHDERLWPDPLTFRPERFLSEKGNLLHPEEFIPFSLGRRVCLGESLAKMELYMYLANIVQRFELRPAKPGKLPPRKYIFGATSPPVGYQLRFIERKRD